MMKTFKDSITGQIWEFDDDVADIHAFPSTPESLVPYTRPTPTAAEMQAAADAEHNAGIRAQIIVLEQTQARPIREAALGIVGAQARIQALDDQIAVLRAQFVK